ncbi:MAG TPA: hypothetical protein VGJ60_20350 [Chloroflexota bacterium]|jgi:predicted RNase H-like nuclease (RuvC/YqgF family)
MDADKTLYLTIPLAEFERLHAEIERLALADRQWADHVKRLAEENERLRASQQHCHCDADIIANREAEIERLRIELRGYEWGLSNANAEEHDIRGA